MAIIVDCIESNSEWRYRMLVFIECLRAFSNCGVGYLAIFFFCFVFFLFFFLFFFAEYPANVKVNRTCVFERQIQRIVSITGKRANLRFI